VTQFGILGPVEVRRDGAEVRLGGRNQRAVLALLLLQPGRVVSIEQLAEQLYGEEAPVTAVTQVHRQVSELRKALDPDAALIETRAPGYAARVAEGDLDLSRFEALSERGVSELRAGNAAPAAEALREALALWRGPALADLGYEPFAQRPIARLDELRLGALERRVEADLMLGRDADLVAELRELAAEYPLRERLREMLMIALYRSGRQVEALEVYRETRRELSESFGVEPGPALQGLERAILQHDPSLTPAAPDSQGTILVAARSAGGIAAALATSPPRALVVARLVDEESALGAATAELIRMREELGPATRVAAFVSQEPAEDLLRLAGAHDPDLILVDAPPDLADTAALLEHSPCDVALVSGAAAAEGSGIVVPFAGNEHDWAAVELGAWLALATGERLRLAGARADPRQGGRDASRLLANASLAVQQTVGVAAEPFLVDADAGGLLDATKGASSVVIGLSPRWSKEGFGEARSALVAGAACPVLVVHRGPRPSGIAPAGSATRFTWSLGISA
jgi:DNA-binding SARP family transcriptional activator